MAEEDKGKAFCDIIQFKDPTENEHILKCFDIIYETFPPPGEIIPFPWFIEVIVYKCQFWCSIHIFLLCCKTTIMIIHVLVLHKGFEDYSRIAICLRTVAW